jgi:hypothetical protein
VSDANDSAGELPARRHYRTLDEPDSQTSPAVVRSNLKRWLESAEIRGPVLDLGTGVGSNLTEIVRRRVAVGADVSLSPLRTAKTIAPVYRTVPGSRSETAYSARSCARRCSSTSTIRRPCCAKPRVFSSRPA